MANDFIDVKLDSLIFEQIHEIEGAYSLLVEKLTKADKMHREKFKDKLVSDSFHSSIGYLFGKVAEGIHSPETRAFGLSMLDSIEEMYIKFETVLSNRNELSEYTSFDLDEYKHAIAALKDYLSGNVANMIEKDARIYSFYLREQHKHFAKIAEEIDEEYCKKV
jgi:hypothetical protein